MQIFQKLRLNLTTLSLTNSMRRSKNSQHWMTRPLTRTRNLHRWKIWRTPEIAQNGLVWQDWNGSGMKCLRKSIKHWRKKMPKRVNNFCRAIFCLLAALIYFCLKSHNGQKSLIHEILWKKVNLLIIFFYYQNFAIFVLTAILSS